MKHLHDLPAWSKLWIHFDETKEQHMREMFDQDPQRAERYWLQVGGLTLDYSKNRINDETMALLFELAREAGVPERMQQMFRGEKINTTENRAVLHVALRNRTNSPIVVDGEDVMPKVNHVLQRMGEFAHEVRSGSWLGYTNQVITDIVNIGIGGSDLGPLMMCTALKPFGHPRLNMHFVSNVDGSQLRDVLSKVHPETTLFIIASKTFTTLETLTNARMARDWFLAALQAKGIETDGAIAKHFVAVSTALDKVAEFGIDPANAFGFWNWVGGRYSVDSAVGTVLAVAIGPENFADFLSGFHTVDEHFATKAPADNVPMLMGLLNVWYVNFFKAGSHAILPYAQYLHRFPAYLQQLTMESNGKSVRWDGSPVTTETGEVFWGEPGTNGQHAFYQLIHQGTQLIPADFIAVANPAHPTKDGGVDVHELFLSNYLAQTAALAFGKTADEVRAEGTAEEIVPARVFAGNRPTTSILAPALTPAVVGELIALYEHITFTQGIVWGIDSFDQWGVELGKKLALEIAPAVQGDEEALAGQDASTRGLITRYRSLRR